MYEYILYSLNYTVPPNYTHDVCGYQLPVDTGGYAYRQAGGRDSSFFSRVFVRSGYYLFATVFFFGGGEAAVAEGWDFVAEGNVPSFC